MIVEKMQPSDVTRIFSATSDAAGQPLRFPLGPGQIDVTFYELPPGATLPVHKHPFPRIGYIMSGTLQVTNSQTGEITSYTAGDVAIEAVDVWHEGGNVSADPVRLLVVDLVEPGTPNIVLR